MRLGLVEDHVNRIHFVTISAMAVLMTATANAGGDEPPITVTRAEIEATKAKIEQAWQFFDATWREAFANAGRSYPAPKLIPYEKACRYRDGGNASYSPSEHVIRYDALFLTCVMKRASLALHSDGDFSRRGHAPGAARP
jgi:predicted metalloprotease